MLSASKPPQLTYSRSERRQAWSHERPYPILIEVMRVFYLMYLQFWPLAGRAPAERTPTHVHRVQSIHPSIYFRVERFMITDGPELSQMHIGQTFHHMLQNQC